MQLYILLSLLSVDVSYHLPLLPVCCLYDTRTARLRDNTSVLLYCTVVSNEAPMAVRGDRCPTACTTTRTILLLYCMNEKLGAREILESSSVYHGWCQVSSVKACTYCCSVMISYSYINMSVLLSVGCWSHVRMVVKSKSVVQPVLRNRRHVEASLPCWQIEPSVPKLAPYIEATPT